MLVVVVLFLRFCFILCMSQVAWITFGPFFAPFLLFVMWGYEQSPRGTIIGSWVVLIWLYIACEHSTVMWQAHQKEDITDSFTSEVILPRWNKRYSHLMTKISLINIYATNLSRNLIKSKKTSLLFTIHKSFYSHLSTWQSISDTGSKQRHVRESCGVKLNFDINQFRANYSHFVLLSFRCLLALLRS